MPAQRFFVAGLLVHARPGRSAAIVAEIEALPRTHVHAVGPSGRLAVVVDADDPGGIARTHLAIGEIDGVMAASLVYEHHEDIDE